MQQLRHALAVEVGEARPEEENMPEMELVLSACAGLVVVIRGVVHFVTHSAYDFFKRTHEYWFPDAQSNIANICVTYLSFSAFETGPCQTTGDCAERIRLYPLYRYAAGFWGNHAVASPILSQPVMDVHRCIEPPRVEI